MVREKMCVMVREKMVRGLRPQQPVYNFTTQRVTSRTA